MPKPDRSGRTKIPPLIEPIKRTIHRALHDSDDEDVAPPPAGAAGGGPSAGAPAPLKTPTTPQGSQALADGGSEDVVVIGDDDDVEAERQALELLDEQEAFLSREQDPARVAERELEREREQEELRAE